MDDLTAFHESLGTAISAKSDYLEKSSVIRLRDHIAGYQANVSSMYNFLIGKGLLQTDPYKGERTVTEIQIPSNEAFSDAEALQEISLRFSMYVSQWEFLVNLFHVSLKTLDLREVKKLMDLLGWIRWSEFSINSSFHTTRAFARIVDRLSHMNDPMAGRIMSSSTVHLKETTKSIQNELKIITTCLREQYKWKVRQEVVNEMKIDPDLYRRKPGDVMNNVKFEVTHRIKESGWYKELIQELLEEDYGENAAGERNAVLERLKVTQTIKKKKTRVGPDEITQLMGIIGRMARCGEPIRSAMLKMNENSRTIQERKKSFGERISEIISTLFRRSGDSISYEISIKDPVTGVVRRETLDMAKFTSLAMKRARVLQELLDPDSGTYAGARASGNAKLEDYIRKYIGELKEIHRRINGLDAYFRSNAVPPELKGLMKSCSLNLKNLKASISETLKALNEYRVKREEQEQLTKLGIED